MKRTFSLSAMMAFFAIQGQVLAAIQSPPVSPIRRDFIQNYVEEAASKEHLEPALLLAIIHVESNFNHKAISRVGAKGLMQLMPETAKDLGYRKALDHRHPRFNILAGAKYLREMIHLFRGDLRLAVAAYNAGPKAVQKYKGIPPFLETKTYVKKVFQQLTVEREKLAIFFSSSVSK